MSHQIKTKDIFSAADLRQITSHGLTVENVFRQLQIFENGQQCTQLLKPCTINEGVLKLDAKKLSYFSQYYKNWLKTGVPTRFVPASGAGTRMFQQLLTFKNSAQQHPPQTNTLQYVESFVNALPQLPFFDQLNNVFKCHNSTYETLAQKKDWHTILAALLDTDTLNYSNLPKGLIPFHQYEHGSRTPIHEHCIQARSYLANDDKQFRMHFTASPEYRHQITKHISHIQWELKQKGVNLHADISIQDSASDTIATDVHNLPFRDAANRLVFRPGGHGSLLRNLQQIQEEVIFIGNVDNIAHEHVGQKNLIYKQALGGLLIEIKQQRDAYLHLLDRCRKGNSIIGKNISEKDLWQAENYYFDTFHLPLPASNNRQQRISNLSKCLNRPIRVCGVVPNSGAVGGGPFWIKDSHGSISKQIVESAQVELTNPDQLATWESATHFNPVDIVCTTHNHEGVKYQLSKHVDWNTCFFSTKSNKGRQLRALEHPGLWNGSMAHWNTLFVEVPQYTFSPVKSILDLLNPSHRG